MSFSLVQFQFHKNLLTLGVGRAGQVVRDLRLFVLFIEVYPIPPNFIIPTVKENAFCDLLPSMLQDLNKQTLSAVSQEFCHGHLFSLLRHFFEKG